LQHLFIAKAILPIATPQPEGFISKNRAGCGQVSPENLLRAAPHSNHRQAKILTPRTSGLAQSFCLPPRNQRKTQC